MAHSGVKHQAVSTAFVVTVAVVLAELLRRAKAAGPLGPAPGR